MIMVGVILDTLLSKLKATCFLVTTTADEVWKMRSRSQSPVGGLGDDRDMGLGRRIRIKTDEEVELIRESSLLVGRTLAEVAALIKPGVTTLTARCRCRGVYPRQWCRTRLKGYGGFPNTFVPR